MKLLAAALVLLLALAAHASAQESVLPPLHQAVKGDDVIALKAILKYSKVDEKDTAGMSPLFHAKKLEAAKILIEAGADVNAATPTGSTPLEFAADSGEPALVRYLISKGAKVNNINKFGITPLHWSAVMGKLENAKILIENGADINKARNDGVTSVHLAASHGGVEMLKFLAAKGGSLKSVDSSGKGPLHWASQNTNTAGLEYLLSKGLAVNAQTTDGDTPLDLARATKNAAAEKILLAKGGAPGKKKTLEEKAREGDAASQFAVAEGIPGFSADEAKQAENDRQKVAWTRKAADQGYAEAEYKMAYYYQFGVGVAKDMAQALDWQMRSANHGYGFAMGRLAEAYLYGEGVPVDYAQALRWGKEGGAKKDNSAMAVLGYMYENGIAGLPQDPTLAVENYGPAALGWHNRRAYDGIVRLANGGNATAQSVLEKLRSKGIEAHYLKN